MLEKILGTDAIKKKILSGFIADAKKRGWKKVIIEIGANNELRFDAIGDDKILVDKNTFDFYREQYIKNSKS